MGSSLTWDVSVPEGVDEKELAAAVQAALIHGGDPSRELEVIYVSDKTLAELHERFLSDASPTDVMAFDLGDDEEGPSGEVYVSVDCASRIASERAVSLQRELALYTVHGCLHLCGFDDHEPEDRAAMRLAESVVLGGLGYPADLAPHEQDADA
ncbi:MAG: putative rRNA maturation factor [Candidatus Paceibacteria bacterium]